MLIGRENLEDQFRKLVANRELSHAYIFFGEPQVGKFSFARRLANFLEFGDFDAADKIITETLIIAPEAKDSGEKSIGIDAARGLKNFLFEKPVNSTYRMAIIDGAESMTDQAQNAILKIAEEPPEHALLILVVSNPDVLLTAVQSRFQKIHFAGLAKTEIAKFVAVRFKLKAGEAENIAELSFGRVGRAIQLAGDENMRTMVKDVKSFLSGAIAPRDLAVELADIENRNRIEPFLTELIAELSRDAVRNVVALKSAVHRLRMLKEWNTNKRIQLEAAFTGGK